MKLLKLIPAAAIALTAFTTFEAKAGNHPAGWTVKNSCQTKADHYKLQKTDTPASYGVYNGRYGRWTIENVSYNCATKWFKYACNETSDEPTCSSWYWKSYKFSIEHTKHTKFSEN